MEATADGPEPKDSRTRRAAKSAQRGLRTLPAWVILAAAAFLAIFTLLGALASVGERGNWFEGTGIADGPCDIPRDLLDDGLPEGDPQTSYEDACVQVLDDEGFGVVPQTGLDDEERPFVRIGAQRSDLFVWGALGSLAIVGSVGLGRAAVSWRRELSAYPPTGQRFAAKSRTNLLAAAALPAGGLVFATVEIVRYGDYVEAAILVALWSAAAPSILSVLDCWTIVSPSEWLTHAELKERIGGLRKFSQLHDRFIALLGAQVTVFVVWWGAEQQLQASVERADLALLGGEFFFDPYNFGSVVLWGTFFTGLLAFAYLPAAGAIRQHSENLTDVALSSQDFDDDYAAYQKQRAALAALLGADQTIQARFRSTVIIAAPLITSLLSSVLSG